MFKIVYLENCPYSKKALEILKKNKEEVILIKVQQSEKEEYKKKKKIQTFPQVWVRKNIRFRKIGGCDDLIMFLK